MSNRFAWLESAGKLLESCDPIKGYFVLEGPPCAGKTTSINSLTVSKSLVAVDELRLPPGEESNEGYLLLERERSKKILDLLEKVPCVIGDRSVVATLAYRHAFFACFGEDETLASLDTLESLVNDRAIILPCRVAHLSISPQTSMLRQSVRDRDVLSGRIWYDASFIRAFSEGTSWLLDHLRDRTGCSVSSLNTERNSVEQTISFVSKHFEVSYETSA